MSCDETQESLSLYCDDGLTPEARALCYEHLEVCPVCREHLDQLRSLRRSLALLSRPAAPSDLAPAINRALAARAASERARQQITFGDIVAEILQPRLIRYAFSSLASLILFASVFVALRPHMLALHEAAMAFAPAMADGPGVLIVVDSPRSAP